MQQHNEFKDSVGVRAIVNRRSVILGLCCWILGLIVVFTYQSYRNQNSRILEPALHLDDSHNHSTAMTQRIGNNNRNTNPSSVILIKKPYNQDSSCSDFRKR